MPRPPRPLPTEPLITEDRTRTLSIGYPTTDHLRLDQLRDFVHRTRNQRGVPNWPGDTPVAIAAVNDELVRLTLSTTDTAAAAPPYSDDSPAIPQDPIPFGDDQ